MSRGEPESFGVRDGLIEPAEVVAGGSAEIVEWRERAVEPAPRQPATMPEAPARFEPAEQGAFQRPRRGRPILIGAGVTVGLAAGLYTAATPDEVTAHCVGEDNLLADNENLCDEEYLRGYGGYYSGGVFYVMLVMLLY